MTKDKKDSESRKGFFRNISIKFGEMARRLGLISDSDLKEALLKQASDQSSRRLGRVLVEDRKMTTSEVNEVLNSQAALEKVMVDKEEKKPAKKKPTKTTTQKAVKKKTAKPTTKKAIKKTTAKTTTKKAVKKKLTKKKPSK